MKFGLSILIENKSTKQHRNKENPSRFNINSCVSGLFIFLFLFLWREERTFSVLFYLLWMGSIKPLYVLSTLYWIGFDNCFFSTKLLAAEGSMKNKSAQKKTKITFRGLWGPCVSAARPFTLCKPPKMLVRGLFSFVHFRILCKFFFFGRWLTLFVHNWFSTCTRGFLGQILRDEKGIVHLFRALEFFPKSPAQTRFLGAQIALTRLFSRCKPTNYPPSDRRVARTRGTPRQSKLRGRTIKGNSNIPTIKMAASAQASVL